MLRRVITRSHFPSRCLPVRCLPVRGKVSPCWIPTMRCFASDDDPWKDIVGVSGTPPPPSEEQKQKKDLSRTVQDMVDTFVEGGGTLGGAMTEEEFLASGLKKGEKAISLEEYANTSLTGKEKEEFESFLNRYKDESKEDEMRVIQPIQTSIDDESEEEVADQILNDATDSDFANATESEEGEEGEGEEGEGGEGEEEGELTEEMFKKMASELGDVLPMGKKPKKKVKEKKEKEVRMTEEEAEEWEKKQEEHAEKIQKRAAKKNKMIDFSLGTVTVPQGTRDRVANLILKYYKKKTFLRPTLHVGKPELTKKERESLDTKPDRQNRIHIPSREENKKNIRQSLHSHVFSDPVDAPKTATEGTFPQIIFGKAESLAFLENFSTGQYGIIHRIFHELEILVPNFTPRMVLDFGSGPGTTLFAADEIWGQNIVKHYLAIEPSSAMLDICQVLHKYDNRALYRRYLSMGKEGEDYDLVVSSCTFTYLQTSRERRDAIRSLWRSVRPGGILVFAETGTPVGFQMVKHIRELLLKEDVPARILAPCPHQSDCPMGEKHWCHFKQRTNLLPHERVRDRSFRDIPFSYIVAMKPSVLGEAETNVKAPKEELAETHWSRIVRAPRKRGGHVYLDLCTPNAVSKRIIITKKQGDDYYTSARKAKWGDGYIDPFGDLPDEPEFEEQVVEEAKAPRSLVEEYENYDSNEDSDVAFGDK